MSALTLTPLQPLPPLSTTEVNMQSLMLEASKCYNTGQYKVSYELYIKALLSAIKEFQQLEFIDQCSVQKSKHNMDNVFSLAHTCLRHAKQISSASKETAITTPIAAAKSKPKVPPKPNCLKGPTSPPPLPMRPTQTMIRTQSDFVKKSSNLGVDYATDSTLTDDEDTDIELDEGEVEVGDDDEEYDDEKVEIQVPRREQPIVNTSSNKKVTQEQKQQKKVVSSASLKVITANKQKKQPKLPRRSSTSNIASLAPSSPSITNAVKSFLSLPGGGNATNNNNNSRQSAVGSAVDDLFLFSNGIIDPQVLVNAQSSHSDNTLQQQTTSSSTYLPMIPQAPLVTVYQSLQKKLDELNKTDDQYNQIQSLLNRVRNIHMSATTVPTILQFHPIIIAYQLTLIDYTIFRNIPQEAILSHSPKTPHPSIVASTDFFNYLTRLIEHAILLQQDASGRAQHMNHWIKVAGKCYELKNYQTLKAVISALGTPPIQRLKRSWSFIPKKSMNLLEELGELMSEASNYGKYRTRLGLSQDEQQQQSLSGNSSTSSSAKRKNSFSKPTVPFLGIFIHDMTYLIAALSKKSSNSNTHNSQWKATSNNVTAKEEILMKDARVSELLRLFNNLQRSPPYSPNVSSAAICTKDINSKNRKRKISHALTRSSAAMKNKTSNNTTCQYDDNNDSNNGEVSIEMQQCLVTQYLLTRSWVSEKTVDELSLIREPAKTARSYSVTDVPNQQTPPPPPITSSVSLTTSATTRSSSGSLTTSSSSNSRPLSIEDEEDSQQQGDEFTLVERKASTGGFWLFGRKSADQGYLKDGGGFGTLQRSPRHFSFEELNSTVLTSSATVRLKKQSPALSIDSSTVRMQREGSQGSLASSIFRKDFWKPVTTTNNSSSSGNSGGMAADGVGSVISSGTATTRVVERGARTPLLNFNSDPSMLSGGTTTNATIQRKGSFSSFTIQPTASTSSDTATTHLQHKKQQHILMSPHPLDNTSTPSATEDNTTAQSDISTSLNWD